MTAEWAYFLSAVALFLAIWAILYHGRECDLGPTCDDGKTCRCPGGSTMSSRKKNERGFWGTIWDTLTCPFVWAIELLIAVLD
ncbi:hypothetical protein MAL1_00202 [Bacteriophage DSS3_MAL1]|nr:hypothetical protein MAL1_00202 [Bacteriophage DSS3_MAL1]